MSCPKKSRGFTLIELLVTISIIAILSAIGLVAYSTVLKQGRDSKRQADLRSIQSALEQYNSDQGFYPAPSPSPLTFDNSTALTSATGNPSPPPTAKKYMNAVPTDPIGSPQPQYSYTASPAPCNNSATKCTSYCLYAKLENSNPGLPAACTDGTGTYNFAVTPP